MTAATTTSGLVMENVSKVFEGQRALDGVDFDVRPGEVHALLGPNGSGKSTLIKILAGYHSPEDGARAWLGGEPLEIGSPAAGAAIRFIHQDLGLVGELDAVDNLALGGAYQSRWWLSGSRERAAARAQLAEYGAEVDVSVPVRSLSRPRQTMLALVRALGSGLSEGDVLVLDEPTAALPGSEVNQLIDLLREIRRRGACVVYVTHRLGEVFQIADRVTVLRDGKKVTTCDCAELDHDRLVQLIVGRPLGSFYPTPPPGGHIPLLELSGIRGDGVAEASIVVCRGEIVGITGLVGSGYEDLLHLAFGSRSRAGGEVSVDGMLIDRLSPERSIAAGMAFAAADRKALGGVLEWTLRENLTLPALRGHGFAGWLSPRRERVDAAEWLGRLNVVPPNPEAKFSSLSGGNQQKVCLARWLRRGALVYLLEEPTNGVDMGAKHAVYQMLVQVARDGAAVLMTSQDPEELCSVCDRVLVMSEGRIVASLSGDGLTEDRVVSESLRRVPAPEREEAA
jgi:ribose transport system ATP-binding protein